jgi:tetratricopeptide (TPR) repeat protein
MEIKKQIQSMIAEAKIYCTQGLLEEAIVYYQNAKNLVEKNEKVKNRETILKTIEDRIISLENEIQKVKDLKESAPVSSEVQDLIKTKFAFSKDENESALEGAIALAKFGQYERALQEFDELLQVDSLRLAAAKNIIRCHIAMSTIEKAVDIYQEWMAGDLFPQDQLYKINIFFKSIIDSKGLDIMLPQVEEPVDFEMNELGESENEDDEFMDISSIGITLDTGSEKKRMIDLDVSFQQGNEINLIISSKNKDLIDNLKVGFRLNDVQFYSPFAIFTGSGIVSAKTQIGFGPKQGDYSLDITVINK